MKEFYLYLDESGDFESEWNMSKNPSLVGGILFEKGVLQDKFVERMIPQQALHCTEVKDSNRYLEILEELKNKNCQFVVFNNEERLSVVNGDITYLNVMAEGILQLLRHLKAQYPAFVLHIIAAVRLKTQQLESFQIIGKNEYINRLQERVLLSAVQDGVENSFTIEFDSARKNKYLMFADIVCNTYLTRNSSKFKPAQKDLIRDLYQSNCLYFSVFENVTVKYVRQLMIEEKFGEAIYEICVAVPSSKKHSSSLETLTDILNQQILQMSSKERDLHLDYVKGRIKILRNSQKFSLSEQLILNFMEKFALKLENGGINVSELIFDLYFHLLTVYTHTGDVVSAEKYIAECRKYLPKLKQNWESLDYYFSFEIRKMIHNMNKAEYAKVIEDATKIINAMQETKTMFSLVDEIADVFQNLRSDILAKAYGTRLQAYLADSYNSPQNLEKAREDSGFAIQEFSTSKEDVSRQLQYRAQIEYTDKQLEKALEYLMSSVDLKYDEKFEFQLFFDMLPTMNATKRMFSVMHYVNIMTLSFRNGQEKLSQAMYKRFKQNVHILDNQSSQHPMQIIYYRLGLFYTMQDCSVAADKMFDKAYTICFGNPDNATMYNMGISMLAEQTLYMKKYAPEKYDQIHSMLRRKISKNHIKKDPSYAPYLDLAGDFDVTTLKELRRKSFF